MSVLALSLFASLAQPAHASDDTFDDVDAAEPVERDAPARVREITRGWYGKSNVGAALYFGNFQGYVKPGSYVSMVVGQDFVDNERSSMAWEVGIGQGLHNGMDIDSQAAYGGPLTQGDLRTYSLTGAYEFSMYPSRRVGVGIRAGAGVLISPLLVEDGAWATVVSEQYGVDAGYHGKPKPLFFGGPTIEYYTKLSHFSVGADVDITYGLGWAPGVNASGTIKYTF